MSVPAPSLVSEPVVVAITPVTAAPAPPPVPTVRFWPAPPMPPEIVKLPASEFTRVALPSVTAPVQVLRPLMLRSAPSAATPVPSSVRASPVTVIPPCSCSAAPEATVVPPAVEPRPALFCTFSAPALIVVAPV